MRRDVSVVTRDRGRSPPVPRPDDRGIEGQWLEMTAAPVTLEVSLDPRGLSPAPWIANGMNQQVAVRPLSSLVDILGGDVGDPGGGSGATRMSCGGVSARISSLRR